MDKETEDKLARVKKSFFGFFIENHRISFLALITIIIIGSYSFVTIKREIQPEIKIPFASVVTALPGASPLDTESLLTDPLEKNISNVDGIKTLSSNSGFGFSSIFIEFEAEKDLEEAVQEVKDAVDRAISELPNDASDPVVSKAKPNDFPIITFSIIADIPTYELNKIAEEVTNELEKLSDISKVNILGKQEKIIEVSLDPEKITYYGITQDQVAQMIKASNLNLPIGLIETGDLNYSLRIDNRLNSIEEIQNLPLINVDNSITGNILLKDIASVSENLSEKGNISKVSLKGQNSLPAVSLQVFKKDDSDFVASANSTKAKVEEMKKSKAIPQEAEMIITNDNSVFIEEELGNLTNNGAQTALIIIFSLFLALGLKQGIIAGISIPLTFLMTFPILQMQGMTFNTLSLFSLVMSLGITIDTTVVIMEGMYENLKKGYSAKDSALLSVDMYKWPIIAGTATNIFAFFPMLIVSGILGQFLKTMPITITAALLTSLFLSLTIIPSLSARFLKNANIKRKKPILENFFEKIGEKFEALIKKILAKKSLRISTITLSLVAFGLSLLLPITGLLPVEMFPQTDQNYFTIKIEKPIGTPIKNTEQTTLEIENYLYQVPEVDNFVTQVGTNSSLGITEDSKIGGSKSLNESHLANITVNLISKDDRKIKSYEIAKKIRSDLENFTQAKIYIEEIKEGPPSDEPITVRITGKSIEEVKKTADQIKALIEKIPQTTNVKMSLVPGQNEFKFTLDREKIALYKLATPQVASILRNSIQGVESSTIKVQGEDIAVIVKYQFKKTSDKSITFEDLKNIQIPTPTGSYVELSELISFSFEKSPSYIEHENEKRIIKVQSGIEKDANLVEINKQIEEEVAKLKISEENEIKFGGDLEEINQSFQELFSSMILGIILIAFCLILMFNSFKQPLIILFTLPLALIGVFPGLYLIGLKLSFPSFLGVVSLGGIVVSNTIVLIDRINDNRKNGLALKEAIEEATKSRIEPIFMTSLSTILGVIPLSLSNAFWAGLGFTIVFGQLFSTILLLIVIPVVYYSFEIKSELKQKGKA